MPHPNFKDLTDQTFTQLTVVKRARNNNRGDACWECLCTCGNNIVVRGNDLRSGTTCSCGCFNRKTTSKRMKESMTTHGLSKTSEYKIWKGIKNRCYNPKATGFKYWGGCGIRVCSKWKNDFISFLNYVGPRPSEKHTIERTDNNGNYEPGNVVWATKQEQANNRSNNHLVTIGELTLTISQWARVVGIKADAIHNRISHHKWTDKRALFTPLRKFNHHKLSHS